MTAAMYLSPHLDPEDPTSPYLPVIIADSLITFEGNNQRRVTPASLTAENREAPLHARLGRKVHALGLAAVAFAGKGEHIAPCYQDVVDHLPRWITLQRPMSELAKHANNYWKYYKAGALEALGSCYTPAGMDTCYLQEVVPTEVIPGLGRCTAVGKGYSDLLSRAREIGQMLAPTPLIERVAAVVGALNGRRLAEEMFGDGNQPNAWGGYLEYVYFDYTAEKWVYGPSTLHLFAVLGSVKAGARSIQLQRRAIGYMPGDAVGRVLTLSKTNAGAVMADWTLARDYSELKFGAEGVKPWTGWRPTSFTLTVVIPMPDGTENYMIRTSEPWEMEFLDLRITADDFQFGLDPKFLTYAGEAACEAIGATLVSSEQ